MLRQVDTLSKDRILVKILSTTPRVALTVGTKLPTWFMSIMNVDSTVDTLSRDRTLVKIVNEPDSSTLRRNKTTNFEVHTWLMSIMNVDSPVDTLSRDRTLVKILSTSPIVALSAGTKLPTWARKTITATWNIRGDERKYRRKLCLHLFLLSIKV